MNYGDAFSFQFKDEEWVKKIGIAALFLLIPIVGLFFLAGWGLEITRRVIVEDPEPLPPWNDFGNYIVKGIQVAVIGFVYALPLTLIQVCMQSVFIFSAESMAGDETFGAVALIAQTCVGCLTFIYAVFLGVFMPAVLGHFAAEGQLGAAFRVGEIFAILKAGLPSYLVVMIFGFVVPFIGMLGLMLCLFGVLFTMPYAITVMQYLYGEAYRSGKADLELTYNPV